MPVTNYYTVNGEIIGEATGGVRTDYLTDALGSVTATLDQSGQVINTYRYKPYGALLAKTGNGSDPAFGWVGTHGYRPTQKKWSDVYVRARHYDTAGGRWTTVDPLQAFRDPYTYVHQRPTRLLDRSGLAACSPSEDCCVAKNRERYSDEAKSTCPPEGFGDCGNTIYRMNTLCRAQISPSDCMDALEQIIYAAYQCIKWQPSYGLVVPIPPPDPNDPDNPQLRLPVGIRPPVAITFCCANSGSQPKACGSYCCPSEFSRQDGYYATPLGFCITACVIEHEKTHRLMCPSGEPDSTDINKVLFDEGCGYLTQMACLYRLYKGKCKKKWNDDPRLAMIDKCLKNTGPRCIRRLLPSWYPFID